VIYRRLGRTGLNISRLGFGAMRLPSREDGTVDRDASVRIMHRAFDLGVNYIDTAVMYCGHESQAVVGEALRTWPDRVYVSTKNHYMGPIESEWWKNLETSLNRLNVACIDAYHLHGLNGEKWETWVKGPNQILSWMQKAQAQGMIEHLCFSFHGSPEDLRTIAAADAFSVVTLQYNLLDRVLEPVFDTLADHDMGIIVMGPVGGGQLATQTESLSALVEGASSPAETAMRFVLAHPRVTAAISGMNSVEQVEENCACADRTEPLSAGEKGQILTALDRLKGLADLYCTGCNYCMPCPHGVDIPANFKAVNHDRVYGLEQRAQMMYKHLPGKAALCEVCGVCEPKCPQDIPIRGQLREAAARFDAAFGQMALDIIPVRRERDGLRLRARFHNVSNGPAKATVRLAGEDGAKASPDTFRVEIDEPFRVHETEFVFETHAVTETITIEAAFAEEPGDRVTPFQLMMAESSRVASFDELRNGGVDRPQIVINREDQEFPGSNRGNGSAALRGCIGHSPEALLIRAVISVGEPESGGAAPAVSLFDVLLDLRHREGPLPTGFHESMFLLRLSRNGTGGFDPFVVRGDLDVGGIEAACREEAAGMCIELKLPWASMGCHMPDSGEAMGLDLVLECQAGEGAGAYRAGWTGNARSRADGITGTLFFA
jgi:uncharacterized protein